MLNLGISAQPAEFSLAPPGRSFLLNHPEIRSQSRIVEYKTREVIIREGMPTSHVDILLSGTAMSYRTAINGHQRVINFLRPGKLFGYMTLFGSFVHTMSVEALERCKILEIEKGQLKRLLLREPALMWDFMEEMAEGVNRSTEIMEESYLSAEKRLYKCLLSLCTQFGYRTANGIELRLRLTQDNLAKYAGTTRVTTAKILSGLIEHGTLRVRPKPWVVYRVDNLIDTRRPFPKPTI